MTVLAGVWAKISQAKDHLDNLERQAQAFWDSEPYKVRAERNPDTGAINCRVEGDPEPIPGKFILTAGNAIHDLRSAFDHFAVAVVPSPPPGQSVAFPVWRAARRPTASQWHGCVHGKLKGSPAAIESAVKGLHAYEGGHSDWLWVIDYLDNVDKHRALIAIAGRNSSFITGFARSLIPPTMEFSDEALASMDIVVQAAGWVRLERDAVLTSVNTGSPTGGDFDPQLKFTMEIALAEPKSLEGEPVIPAFRKLIDQSESLLRNLAGLI